MAKNKIISDRLNTFFTNNKLTLGDSIPTSGTWNKGDIVVSSVQESGECAWICVEAGTPGTWEVFGAGGGGNLVSVNTSVIVDTAVTEVTLSGLGFNVNPKKDKLIVHFNSTHLLEGVDYNISEDGTKIVKLGGGQWNESNSQGSMFAFELLKQVPKIENGNVVLDAIVKQYNFVVNQPTPTNEVELPINDFNNNFDMLEVFKNGVLINEGKDFTIDPTQTKIVKVGGGNWNETSINPYNFTFIIYRNVERVDENITINNENIQDGSLTLDKLHPSVADLLRTKAVRLQKTVSVPKATSRVNIGINEYHKNYDILTVVKNGTVIVEGVDFDIDENSTVIISKNGDWNPSNDQEYSFTFFVTKNVRLADDEYIINTLNIQDGAITKEKLHVSVITELGGEEKIKEYVGDKNQLQTETKTDLVVAINELSSKINGYQNNLVDIVNKMVDM